MNPGDMVRTECQYASCDKPAECQVILPHNFVTGGEERQKEYCAYHAEQVIMEVPGAETDE